MAKETIAIINLMPSTLSKAVTWNTCPGWGLSLKIPYTTEIVTAQVLYPGVALLTGH